MTGLAPTIGRADELRRPRAEFPASPTLPVGKTSLARAYAQRHRAEDPTAIDAEFNIGDPSIAYDVLPPAGPGHILITSEATAWPDPGVAELHREGHPSDYPHTVATMWQLVIDRLPEPARELLNLLAFCAPNAIPVDLLFDSSDEPATRRSIGALRAHSLITTTGPDRLVQSVTRDRLGAHIHEWAERARVMIEGAGCDSATRAGRRPLGDVGKQTCIGMLDWEGRRPGAGARPARRSGPGVRAIRCGRETCWRSCCRTRSGPWAPSMPIPLPRGGSWRTGVRCGMSDPELAVRYLVEQLIRKARPMPPVPIGIGEASLDTLHKVVAARLGDDSALTHLEAAVARLRRVLRDAMDNDPQFAANLRAALARIPPPGLGGGIGGLGGRGPARTGSGLGAPPIRRYAVEDVWVDEKEQADPPEPGESSPRT